MVKVIANGRSYDLAKGRSLDYISAVKLALRTGEAPIGLTVTWRTKTGQGTLRLGHESVEAVDGLVINVADTGNA